MSGIRVELELDNGTFTSRMLHAGETVAQFERNVGRGITSVSKLTDANQAFLNTLRGVAVALGVATVAMTAARMVTSGWIADIIGVNAEFERLTVLMKSMSTAADPMKEAADQVRFLRDYAKQAPFELAALADSFVKMKATGIDPMNGALKNLVDGIAAAGGKEDALKRATIAIQQMSGKGVIQMEELRQQLGEAMPRAVEIMARSMGVTMGELIQKIATGTVEARSALAAFSGELGRTFGGAAEQQMTTFNGLLSQSKTLLQNLALDAGETGFFAVVKKQLQDVNAFLSSQAGGELAKSVGGALTTIVGWLRQGIEWIVQFRNELMTIGQVMIGAFAVKAAAAGLLSLGGLLTTITTEVRTFAIAWAAMQRTMMVNNIAVAIGQLGLAGAGISRMTGLVRNLSAALGVLSIAIAGVSSIALPLTAIVLGVAYAFGLFSNNAKDAYETIEQFGAQSQKQVTEASGYIGQIEEKLARAKEMRDSIFATPASRIFWDQYYNIPELEAELERVRGVIAKARLQAVEEEAKAAVSARMTFIGEQTQTIQKTYDEEFKIRYRAHEETLKLLQNEGRDTQKERETYTAWVRNHQLKFYDEQIRLLEGHIEGSQERQINGDAAAIRQEESVQAELLRRQRSFMEQREALSKQAAGLQTIAKPDDIEKIVQRAKIKIDEMSRGIAEQKAEIAGASTEYARLIYMIEQAQAKKNKLPIDNEEIEKLKNELKALGVELDELTAKATGQTKFDRELERIYEKAQADLLEARTRGKNDLDKLAVAVEMGLYNGRTATSRIAQQFTQVNSAARLAADGMSTAFGEGMRAKGLTMVSVVEQLRNAWLGVKTVVDQTSFDKTAPSGGVRPFATYTGGTYAENLIRRESSANPNAKADGSTALGLGQFIEGTWLDFLKDMRPDMLAAGREAALDLRRDPTLMREAIDWYAQKNAARLQNENLETSDANLYLAHFLGPDGAIAALKKSSDALLASIPQLSAARGANPGVFKDLMTVGDLKSWAESFMGKGFTARTSPDGAGSIDKLVQSLDPGRASIVREITRLHQETAKLKGENELVDYMRDVAREIDKASESEEGFAKRLAATKKLIRDGKFGADTDPDSVRYQTLIKLATDWDAAEKRAQENKKLRTKLQSMSERSESEEAALAAREADLRRRFEGASSFKPSNQYFRELASIERERELVNRGLTQNVINQGEGDRLLADLETRLARIKDLEVGNTVQIEQEKTRRINESLMTQNEAREASHQEEVRRLQDLLANFSLNGEQRALVEGVIQEKIRAHRAKTTNDSAFGRQMQQWRDLGAQVEQSFTGWIDRGSSELANFLVTGKADWQSFSQSIMTDLARMSIRNAFSGMIGMMGGPSGGGAAKAAGTAAIVRHGGGMADWSGQKRLVNPSVFKNARRFHDGLKSGAPGLGPGEIPAIVKKGEVIDYPENLAKAFGGSSLAQSNTFNVNVNGQPGTPAQNQDLAERIGKQIEPLVRQMASKEIRTQMRPGGILKG